MALDALILGPFIFDGFSTPEKLPFGGKQQTHVHKMPGGSRVVDCMGPDDDDRTWSGTFWGANALADALTLDALRRSGQELPYSNGVEARTVVIADFQPRVRKFNCVEYTITVTPTDGGEDGFGGGLGGMISAIDGLVGADLDAALSTAFA